MHHKADQTFSFFYTLNFDVLEPSFTIITGFIALRGIEILLPEIVKLEFATACVPVFAILYHIWELPHAKAFVLVFWYLILHDETLEGNFISPSIKKYAFGILPITTRSSTLLIIIFQRFRQRMMNNKPNIRLINSHPKRDSGNNNLYPIFHPLGLNLTFLVFTYVGVVECYFKTLCLKLAAHLLAVFAGNTVYYAGLVLVVC